MRNSSNRYASKASKVQWCGFDGHPRAEPSASVVEKVGDHAFHDRHATGDLLATRHGLGRVLTDKGTMFAVMPMELSGFRKS